jgi:hypothetical protein
VAGKNASIKINSSPHGLTAEDVGLHEDERIFVVTGPFPVSVFFSSRTMRTVDKHGEGYLKSDHRLSDWAFAARNFFYSEKIPQCRNG